MDLIDEFSSEIIENAPQIILIIDRDGTIRYINRTAAGINPETIVGTNHLDYIDPEYHELVKASVAKVFETGEVWGYEIKGLRHDDSFGWYHSLSGPIRRNGEIVHVVIFSTDITLEKATAQALLESEEKNKTLVNNVPGMIYRAKPDWSVDIIAGSGELCGYTKEEIYQKDENWLSIVHPDDRSTVMSEGAKIRDKPGAAIQTYRIISKDGTIRWIEDRKVSLFSENGQFTSVDGIVIDITDRIQTEEELKNTQDSLIAQQSRAIRELSTPVIQIWDDILVLPLIGAVDTARAQQIIENLLSAITKTQSLVAIMDITGVEVIDTSVASHIIKTIQAAKMLGTTVIISGMSPNNAQTMVQLGITLEGFVTVGSLKAGLKRAFSITKKKY